MSDQRKDYGKRPSSFETGARNRTQYDKPYGKKPYQRDKKNYGNDEHAYRKPGDRKPYGGEPQNKKPFDRNEKPFDRKRSRDEQPKRSYEPAPIENERDEQPYLLIGRNAVREAIKRR